MIRLGKYCFLICSQQNVQLFYLCLDYSIGLCDVGAPQPVFKGGQSTSVLYRLGIGSKFVLLVSRCNMFQWLAQMCGQSAVYTYGSAHIRSALLSGAAYTLPTAVQSSNPLYISRRVTASLHFLVFSSPSSSSPPLDKKVFAPV